MLFKLIIKYINIKYINFCVEMHDDGMEPLPISLKLGIPFSTVMDTLNNIPPISGKGIRSDIGKDAKPDMSHRDILGDEKA